MSPTCELSTNGKTQEHFTPTETFIPDQKVNNGGLSKTSSSFYPMGLQGCACMEAFDGNLLPGPNLSMNRTRGYISC